MQSARTVTAQLYNIEALMSKFEPSTHVLPRRSCCASYHLARGSVNTVPCFMHPTYSSAIHKRQVCERLVSIFFRLLITHISDGLALYERALDHTSSVKSQRQEANTHTKLSAMMTVACKFAFCQGTLVVLLRNIQCFLLQGESLHPERVQCKQLLPAPIRDHCRDAAMRR